MVAITSLNWIKKTIRIRWSLAPTNPISGYYHGTRQLPKATLEALIEKAKQLGYGTDKLIFVNQDMPVDQHK